MITCVAHDEALVTGAATDVLYDDILYELRHI